jgi:hypothetical protein
MYARIFFVTLACVCIVPHVMHAASISPVSDLIVKSQPGTSTPHIISFKATNGVPSGGIIRITPEDFAFSVPGALDHTDIDLLVSSGGPYAQRDVGAVPGVALDGVSTVSGYGGSITITLGTTPIGANDLVRILVGSNATHQSVGDVSPINATTVGSYRIRIETESAGSIIDNGKAMIVILQPVGVSAAVEASDPVRSNGLPSGTIAAGSATIEISLRTDKSSTCRYATSSSIAYNDMTATMSNVSGLLHYRVISGHVDSTSYTYYVRCADTLYNIQNTTDYPIAFALGAVPSVTSSDGNTPGSGFSTPGVGGSGGSGPFPNGSAVLFKATVAITGKAPANTTVTILRDGKQESTTQAGVDGSFSTQVTGLERGTYTFVAYATDALTKRTSNFSSTLTLTSGSANTISNVILSPTVNAVSDRVEIGADISLSGSSVPGTTIELTLRNASSSTAGAPRVFTASSSPSGAWEYTIPGAGIARGTYEIRAKSIGVSASSNASPATYVGVGEAPARVADTANRSDINRDGRVNLVDFSIMLTNWGTDDADSDINEDGSINLADFSIMLFNWTG